ncbi:MAG: L,D-transpeptidase [Nocardioidaceae bacterium]
MIVRGTGRACARSRSRRMALGIGTGVAMLSLGACQVTTGSGSETPKAGGPSVPQTSAPAVQPLRLTTNVPAGKSDVSVDTAFQVRATGGKVSNVFLFYRKRADGHFVPGALNRDGTTWRASGLLEPGKHYHAVITGLDADGAKTTRSTAFGTRALTLAQQTYPSIAPLQGQTVGIGMPVIVKFDVPVTNRAAIEKHLSVTSTPTVVGSWHWISANEIHYRPKTFWKPGTHVTVHADINGVNAGNGVFGQVDNSASFVIGDSVIDRINLRTDLMKVVVNGKVARTIPVTGGMPGFDTRSGTKVIVEKFPSLRMDAATVGIPKGSPQYYDIPDVQYAMRVTYSGEFLHAAPWSEASQGVQNVSHGCVGMSTANAQWLYDLSHVGDVVQVTGSDRSLEPNNGWTDWNESFAAYRRGSALHH